MLTNAAAKAAQPQARAYKMFDAGGLHLFVAPTGRKTWRLKYRISGREKLLTIGAFPEVSVAEARGKREAAKEQLHAGADPAVLDIQVNTFEQLARAWYQHKLPSWSPAHAVDVLGSLERDIFPSIGAMSIDDITAPALLKALRLVERRGRIETARRLRQRLSEIFAYGIAEGLATADPAAKLGAAMISAPPARPQPALTSIEDCRALLAAADHIVGATDMVALASRFLALTAVRLAAVRGARWGEIEGIDTEVPQWRVPAKRMKLAKAKKGEARFDHVVPLSGPAVAVLHRVADMRRRDANMHSDDANLHADGLVFAGRTASTPIGEGAIGALYVRAGFTGRHVPHGWRSSFSTILNEQLGDEWRSAIDRALAHSPKDKVEAAYNRAEQLTRRRDLLERWAALLTD